MNTFDNIRLHSGGYVEFCDRILHLLNSRPEKKIIIVHINLNNLYYLLRDPQLKDEIDEHSVVVLDGIGMQIGLWIRGFGVLPNLNGTDMFPVMMERITSAGLRVFLLGAEERVIENAALNMIKRFPGLELCGFNHGYFSQKEEMQIIQKINESKSDVLIIGRGFPLQEQFVLKHKDELRTSLIWNVGGLFDMISGRKSRAPHMLRLMRLEWLFRFVLEPRRMLRRNTICAFWSLREVIFGNKFG